VPISSTTRSNRAEQRLDQQRAVDRGGDRATQADIAARSGDGVDAEIRDALAEHGERLGARVVAARAPRPSRG
jgi:hypothetical protein